MKEIIFGVLLISFLGYTASAEIRNGDYSCKVNGANFYDLKLENRVIKIKPSSADEVVFWYADDGYSSSDTVWTMNPKQSSVVKNQSRIMKSDRNLQFDLMSEVYNSDEKYYTTSFTSTFLEPKSNTTLEGTMTTVDITAGHMDETGTLKLVCTKK